MADSLVASARLMPADHARDGALGGRGVALLLALFSLIWLGLLGWSANTAPADNLEQLVWVRSLEWGYYKHPPLPTWLLAPLVWVFGPQVWATYVLGAACTTASLALMWATVRAMRGPRHATIVLLAALCVTFYALRLHYFNHNVVMMLTGSIAVALLWRVTHRPSGLAWAGIGLALGLGMLAKYQTLLVVAGVTIWWWRAGLWRDPRHRRGALLATGLAVLLMAPHVAWLFAHDLAPLRYAERSSLGAGMLVAERPLHALNWTADWLLNRMGPAWLLLALTAALVQRRGALSTSSDVNAPAAPDDRRRREFLTLFGLAPLVVMALMSLLGAASLQEHWGTAFALWTVPAVLEWMPRARARLSRCNAIRMAWIVLALLQALLLVNRWSGSPRGPLTHRQHHWGHFPSAMLAERVAPAARALLGGPIDLIAGDQAVAGALATALPEKPRVLILGRLDISPWIDASELDGGARVVEVFPADVLPPRAQWAGPGWAWRVGVSPLAGRTVTSWRQPRWEPAPDEQPGR